MTDTAAGTRGLTDGGIFIGGPVEYWTSPCGRCRDGRGKCFEEFGVGLWRSDWSLEALFFLLDDVQAVYHGAFRELGG